MGWDVCWWRARSADCQAHPQLTVRSTDAANTYAITGKATYRITRVHETAKSHLLLLVTEHVDNRRCRCKLRLDVARMLNNKGEGEQLKFLVSLLLLVSVVTANAQRNRQLKDAADDVRAARSLPNFTPPAEEPCNLNNRASKPKNALELSRACGQLSVVANLTSVVNQESVERCRRFGFWPW
jgi:hypothetical protein